MKKAFLLFAILLAAVGILLTLAQRILEWKQGRERSGPPAGQIQARMPEWLGNVGLALIALAAVIACAPLLAP